MKAKNSIFKSFQIAGNGIVWMLKNERNFQIELLFFLGNLFLIFFLHLSKVDSILILLSCAVVLTLEIMNTALEIICDFIHPEYHPKIGVIKDVSAGAVLLAALFSVIIGVLVYYPYFYDICF
jgi:diacylglycerol kinase (ATP)